MDYGKRIIIPILALAFLLGSCNQKSDNEDSLVHIETISSIDNFNDTVIFMDYTHAMDSGFIIPTKPQTTSGYFNLKFKVVNNTPKETKYYYKIYYQNESYKFHEVGNDGLMNPLCAENFYGSYEKASEGFRETQSLIANEMITVTDSIRIMGNPRDEQQYFGNPVRFREEVPIEEIENKIKAIKNSKEWFENIVEKAKKNGISVDDQLWLDAEYIINFEKDKGNDNNRWKRNPRTGKYRFMIVIVPQSTLDKIPEYIKNISLQNNGTFVNPFYYYHYGDGHKLEHLVVKELARPLAVKAKLPISNGVWIPKKNNMGDYFDTSYFSAQINSSKTLFKQAPFKIYGNYRPQDDSIYNVPVVADFFGKGYSQKEYEKDSATPRNKRIPITFTNNQFPGKNIKVDTEKDQITISNPGCTLDDPKKENAGIITRHGFNYGKFTAKVKLSQQLTDDNVWNGLTNAIWLITESLDQWNARRICTVEGYMPHYGAGKEYPRVPQISYSEIDFEIVKAAETWPGYCYPDRKEREEPISNADKVMVTCTNWDMACKQPENFAYGVFDIIYGDRTFPGHRWDEWYNAVTQKTPVSDDILFQSDYFYFQIEWKPTEIIWRIGPEKDQLRVVGYINDQYSNIPNNQMLLIFTQEYHYSHWWPKSPFKQENIPFPAEDMEGIIYEVMVE
jgi:hypothetical protein